MHSTFALAALAAVAYAAPAPQAVTQPVGPSAAAPAGCSTSYNGKFQISAVNVTSSGKRSIEERQSSCGSSGSLTLTLASGTLTDGLGRTGCIVANRQFQFDGPPQAGTIYNTGFSTCSNGTLALGGSTIFYQCLSGSFYNLYDQTLGAHCNQVYLQVLPCSGGSAAPPVSQLPDGQPQATTGKPQVTQIGDGQVQAPTGKPAVTQIGDGQVQAPTGKAPVTQIGDGQVQAPTGKAPVTQIGDGQVQAPTGKAPVTQIGDGQIQAPTGKAPVTQIGDGQIQAPTGRPITQIGDGQIQAPTGTPTPTAKPAPITQISDGQIQAPTKVPTSSVSARPPVVTQIGDGQIQAPKNATSSPIAFPGAASGSFINSALVVVAVGLTSLMML